MVRPRSSSSSTTVAISLPPSSAPPFEQAAVLSIGGSGDFTTTMMARGKGTDIEVLDSLDFPASVGLFYTAFTQYLGFLVR